MDNDVAINVENVTMSFILNKEKVDNLKEYAIKLITGKLEYNKFDALKDISFQVKKGEHLAIMGLNGAGKSTLLKTIVGVYKPTKGKIEKQGVIAPLLELGAGFDGNYSGRENIFLYGAILGYSREFIQSKYDEIVEFSINDGAEKRLGRIIEIYEDKAIIQVFEGSEGMSLTNTHTKLTGHPMEVALSPEILGRTFNGIGKPIDGLAPIVGEKRDVNGKPLNPVSREYPRNYIRTGISAIDGLTTLIRGQKLPIFSGNGLPHDQLAAQLVNQSSLGDDTDEKFAVVFAAMGVKNDVADFFKRSFEESGALEHTVMFLNMANDPVVERLITPKVALTVAEYLAYEKDMHILVILTDMTLPGAGYDNICRSHERSFFF